MPTIKMQLPLLLVALIVTACGVPALRYASHPTRQVANTVSDEQNGVVATNSDTLPSPTNPDNGKKLFNTFQPAAGIACSTCHRVDSEERLVGPGLLNVGIRAATRIKGQAAVAYLHDSIVN